MSDELMELAEGWKWAVLDDICEKITDGEHLTPPLVEEGIPLLSAKDVRDFDLDFSATKFISKEVAEKSRARCNPEKNDILVVSRGATVGRTCRVSVDKVFCLMGSVLLFKLCKGAKGAVESAFVEFFFKSPSGVKKLTSMSGASAQQAIYIRDMRSFHIPLPPLNEQKRIIDAIAALRDRTQKAREALEAIPALCDKFRQSVLAAAFRGDLTADWREQNPDVEPASVLLERTAKQLGQNLEVVSLEIDREHDSVPIAWAWTKLKLIVKKIQPGNNFLCPEVPVTESTVGLVKISAVTWGKFDPKETKTVADPSKVNPNLFIQPGDLLVTRANTIELVGASVVVDEVHYRIMLSDKVWRIDVLEVDRNYINYYLRSKDGRREIESRATGNQLSMRNISQSAFKDIVIAIPPLEEQKEIVQRIESCFRAIDQIQQQYQQIQDQLNQLDRSILAKAFRGELVEQNPNDEPASVLLERIRAEREKLAGEKKGKGKGTTSKGRKASSKGNSTQQMTLLPEAE